MNEQQAQALISKVRDICREYKAYCQIVLSEKPDLEHVKIEINAKVEVENNVKLSGGRHE